MTIRSRRATQISASLGITIAVALAIGYSLHLGDNTLEVPRLADLLGSDPRAKPVGWPLRGELISHLDRLRNEL